MIEPTYEELRADLKETKEKLQSREAKLRELGVTDLEPKPLPPEEKIIIPICHHIKENGRRCGSPAVDDRDYCYFHLNIRGRRLKMARARARGEHWRLELPPLEDLYSVQVGLQQVLDAMSCGQIDRGMGYGMLYGLQQAATNLRLTHDVWQQSGRFENQERITWQGFEEEHGLPQGFDVDTSPDEAFPPPKASPGAITATGEAGVTEDDIELEELLARDPKACVRRAAQLARKYQRRLQHEEDKLARACRILEAARRNEEARRKAPASLSTEAPRSDAQVVSAEAEAPAADGGARKAPQGEANKKDEAAEDAS